MKEQCRQKYIHTREESKEMYTFTKTSQKQTKILNVLINKLDTAQRISECEDVQKGTLITERQR